ncbi:hypothetical protein [Streptomyces lavendulocolor]|uniref:hypothetical protein n=1 Tax=Streptomyces lavendulocolor TaxID=67316 RepID=UPI0031CF3F54
MPDTSNALQGAEITNPANPIPQSAAEAMDQAGEAWRASRRQAFEIARAVRPTEFERSENAALLTTSVRTDLNSAATRRKDKNAVRRKQLDELAASEPATMNTLVPPANLQPVPVSKDSEFWFSLTSSYAEDIYTSSNEPNGVHFKGKKTYDDGDLAYFAFGAVFRYTLGPDRIPYSPSGQWRSHPFVDIQGSISGNTSVGFFPDGDFWSKCWMMKRQSLFQHTFAPPGVPPWLKIAESIERKNLIFIEEWGGFDEVFFRGFESMPEITTFPHAVNTASEIMAELEVRFEIQLEGMAGLWIMGDSLIVQGDQWPFKPVVK